MREMKKDPLLIYLRTSCRGKDNRVSGAQLACIHGISISALQGRVRRLRQQGHPIASDAYGYYYAVTAGEVFATIRRHQKLIRALEADIHGLVASMDTFQVPQAGSGDGGDTHR